MKNHIEIERKFLLKKVPHFNKKPKEVISISQYYLPSKDGMTLRIRKATKKSKTVYYVTEKKKISAGVCYEKEYFITRENFYELLKSATKEIHKLRVIHEVDKFLWEVDIYTSINLVTVEIELKRKNQKFNIPSEISEVLIKDVTKYKEFSNQNLAILILK